MARQVAHGIAVADGVATWWLAGKPLSCSCTSVSVTAASLLRSRANLKCTEYIVEQDEKCCIDKSIEIKETRIALCVI